MHPLQFNHCSQSQVAAPTCARQLTDGSAQSNCSSRRSATLPITFFLISKIWKGDLRARFCVQLWILMNELCGFSQNRHPTSPALRLEAGTCCLQSQPTWDLCGPPKTTFLKTPSSCGPYYSNLRIIELPNIASNCLGTGCKCWYNQNSHPFSMSSNIIGWNALALQASDGDLCVLQLQKERTARVVHRRYGWRRSQPVILEHCKLGATSYLVTKSLFFIMKHIGPQQKTTNYAK